MYIVGRQHIVRHVSLVDVYVRPLAALCLVARHGIGILYLQGIVVGVFLKLLVALGLGAYVGIIEHHLFKQAVALLTRQSRSLGRERVG